MVGEEIVPNAVREWVVPNAVVVDDVSKLHVVVVVDGAPNYMEEEVDDARNLVVDNFFQSS